MSDTKDEMSPTEGALFILAVPVMVAISGYTVSALWAWFLVPLGLPPIGVAHGAGLNLLAHYVTSQTQKDSPPTSRIVVTGLLYPLVVLACGWITHLVMVR